MEGEGAVQQKIEQYHLLYQNKLEKLAALCALVIITASFLVGWPAISSIMNNRNADYITFGYSALILIWGMFIQDLTSDHNKAQTRIFALCAIVWLPIATASIGQLSSDINQFIACCCFFLVSGILYFEEKKAFVGKLEVKRFQSVMHLLGWLSAVSITVSSNHQNSLNLKLQLTLIIVVAIIYIYQWINADDERLRRKRFGEKMDLLEIRILELRSNGVVIDQAASLLMTAKQQGYRNLDYGEELIASAEEEIERTLSFSDDVDEIRADTEKFLKEAEEIAIEIKKPGNLFKAGLREIEFGSLREGEMLFRESKKKSQEIIVWWKKAQDAIELAKNMLGERETLDLNQLSEILSEAKKLLQNEEPKKAYAMASTIPLQLESTDLAMAKAIEKLEQAQKAMKSTEGLNTEDLFNRLEKAEKAMHSGNQTLVSGISDGIIREIESERAAMDDVLRALKQKKHLIQKWKDRDDKSEWDAKLEQIELTAEDLSWTHALKLLSDLTKELDGQSQIKTEVIELLEYLKEQWKILRNQCEASNMDMTDSRFVEIDGTMSEINDKLEAGMYEKCFLQLSHVDEAMESLRREV